MPAEWIAAATARQVSNGSSPTSDWEQGYGYQFWRCRHGVYRGDGAFGQFCIVMPEQDAVVAITSGTRDLHGVMNLVWEHILPALQPTALPPDERAVAALRRKLAGLVAAAAGRRGVQGRSPRRSRASATCFPSNDAKLESVAVEFGRGRRSDHGAAGRARQPHALRPAARGARATACSRTASPRRSPAAEPGPRTTRTPRSSSAYETPFVQTLALQWKGDELLLDTELNVAFGERKRPRLVGRRESK